jgi:hypothetical protein
MSSAQTHHDEADRLLALVGAGAYAGYSGNADHLPVLLAALVHATLANSAAAVNRDKPGSAAKDVLNRRIDMDPSQPDLKSNFIKPKRKRESTT